MGTDAPASAVRIDIFAGLGKNAVPPTAPFVATGALADAPMRAVAVGRPMPDTVRDAMDIVRDAIVRESLRRRRLRRRQWEAASRELEAPLP